MDITAIVIGVAIGAVLCFVVLQFLVNKGKSKANTEAERILAEANSSAKKVMDSAQHKADKMISQAELENEKIKQRKIQEAKERYVNMRSEFDSQKAKHMVEMKDREMEVKTQENELKQKVEKFEDRVKGLDNQKQEPDQERSLIW